MELQHKRQSADCRRQTNFIRLCHATSGRLRSCIDDFSQALFMVSERQAQHRNMVSNSLLFALTKIQNWTLRSFNRITEVNFAITQKFGGTRLETSRPVQLSIFRSILKSLNKHLRHTTYYPTSNPIFMFFFCLKRRFYWIYTEYSITIFRLIKR